MKTTPPVFGRFGVFVVLFAAGGSVDSAFAAGYSDDFIETAGGVVSRVEVNGELLQPGRYGSSASAERDVTVNDAVFTGEGWLQVGPPGEVVIIR